MPTSLTPILHRRKMANSQGMETLMRQLSLKVLHVLATLFLSRDYGVLYSSWERTESRFPRIRLALPLHALLCACMLIPAPQYPVIAQAPTTLAAPTNLTASVSAEGVTLSWTAPVGPVDGYEILRWSALQDETEPTTLVENIGSSGTSYTDTSATTPGDRYAYRVKAIRGDERSAASYFVTVHFVSVSCGILTGDNHDIRQCAANATLTAPLPAITSRIQFEGAGHSISGDAQYRVLTVVGGQLSINDLTITKGLASTVGGAIYVNGSSLSVKDSAIKSSKANDIGGGLSSFSSFVTLTHTTWANNLAQEQGGGIAIIGWTGKLKIRNTLITDSASGGDCHSGPNPNIIIEFSGNFIQDGSCTPQPAETQAAPPDSESDQAQSLLTRELRSALRTKAGLP